MSVHIETCSNFLNSGVCKLTVTFTCADGKRRCLLRREHFLSSFGHHATTPVRETAVLNSIVLITRHSPAGYLCSVLNCATYLVCENILSIRNRASGLPESSLRALVADAMENSPASDALPPHPLEARRAPIPWRFHLYVPHGTIMYSRRGFAIQHVKNCIEGSTVAVLISMGCQRSGACVASASLRGPLFCTKESLDCP
jgi:hypothetical protein